MSKLKFYKKFRVLIYIFKKYYFAFFKKIFLWHMDDNSYDAIFIGNDIENVTFNHGDKEKCYY